MAVSPWKTSMSTMLRTQIDDVDLTNAEYTRSKLVDLLIVAAVHVVTSVDFDRTYTIDVNGQEITPDPTTYNDLDFQILVVLKAICILAQGEYRNKSRSATIIKDGPSTIDTGKTAAEVKAWMKGVCKDYQDALLSYKMGNGLSGKAIVGPYNIGMVQSSGRN
jgi:hypothetical protein